MGMEANSMMAHLDQNNFAATLTLSVLHPLHLLQGVIATGAQDRMSEVAPNWAW